MFAAPQFYAHTKTVSMKLTLKPLILITLGVLIGLSSFASANMYKWTDDDGVVHYSQTPPMDREAELIRESSTFREPRSTPTQGEEATAAPETESEPADGATSAPEEEAGPSEAERRAAERERQEQCRIARQRITEIENNARVRTQDASGEYRFLTEEERQQRLKEAQDYVRKHCR